MNGRRKLLLLAGAVLGIGIVVAVISWRNRPEFEMSASSIGRSAPVSKAIGPFLDLQRGRAIEPQIGWSCADSECTSDGERPANLALQIWGAYALTGVRHILADDPQAAAYSRALIKTRLTSALRRYNVPSDTNEARTVEVFFSQLREIGNTFAADPELSPLSAALTAWSAAQLAFDTELLLKLNPTIADAYPLSNMNIAIYARNAAAVEQWLSAGKFSDTLQTANISPETEKLRILSGAVAGKLASAETAMATRIPYAVKASFDALSKIDAAALTTSFDKSMRDVMGFGRATCWSALAKYEARHSAIVSVNEAEIDQLMEQVVAPGARSAFSRGILNLFDLTPCIELAEDACRKEGRYCATFNTLAKDFALPQISMQDGMPGGFLNFPASSSSNGVSFSTSAQLLYSLGQHPELFAGLAR